MGTNYWFKNKETSNLSIVVVARLFPTILKSVTGVVDVGWHFLCDCSEQEYHGFSKELFCNGDYFNH